jgi:hypothetical protein
MHSIPNPPRRAARGFGTATKGSALSIQRIAAVPVLPMNRKGEEFIEDVVTKDQGAMETSARRKPFEAAVVSAVRRKVR